MKARGIVIIDYDLPGGFKDAAQELSLIHI